MRVKCVKNYAKHGKNFIAGEIYPACPVLCGYQISEKQCAWDDVELRDITVVLDDDFSVHFKEAI